MCVVSYLVVTHRFNHNINNHIITLYILMIFIYNIYNLSCEVCESVLGHYLKTIYFFLGGL